MKSENNENGVQGEDKCGKKTKDNCNHGENVSETLARLYDSEIEINSG